MASKQVKVGKAAMSTWQLTRRMEWLMSKEAESEEDISPHNLEYEFDICFRQLFSTITRLGDLADAAYVD